MLAHTTLRLSDYHQSKKFYTDVLRKLDYRNNMEFGESAGFNDGNNIEAVWYDPSKAK